MAEQSEVGGGSYVAIEAPDVFAWHLIGTIEVEEIRDIYAKQVEFCNSNGPHFLIVYTARTERITTDARRAFTNPPRLANGDNLPVLGTAVVGASFHMRIITNMITKARQALSKEKTPPRLFVENVAEAYAWFDEMRKSS